jgi:hypothetical protein
MNYIPAANETQIDLTSAIWKDESFIAGFRGNVCSGDNHLTPPGKDTLEPGRMQNPDC